MIVHGPVNGHDRTERFELVQDRRRREVACVDEQARLRDELETSARKGSRPARHVRVCDEGDHGTASARSTREEPARFPDELAVGVHLAVRTQVADQVPVDP